MVLPNGISNLGEEHRVYVRRHTSLNVQNFELGNSSPALHDSSSAASIVNANSLLNLAAKTKKRWSNPLSSKNSVSTSDISTNIISLPQHLSPSKLFLTSTNTLFLPILDDKNKSETSKIISSNNDETNVGLNEDDTSAGHDLIPYTGVKMID